jgi:hypothetical protein
MTGRVFTVIDVLRRLGIPTDPKYTWAAGQAWCREYKKRTNGREGELLLQQKTDPNPTVNAPHGIRSYPMEYFEAACDFLGVMQDSARAQTDLFD